MAPSPWPAMASFCRALLAFAGASRGKLALIILIGALAEGAGLALLLPILKLLSNHRGSAVGHDSDRLSILTLSLCAFVALLVIRALALSLRDRRLARLQHGFAEHERSTLLTALGGADWHDVMGVRHGRVLQALDDNMDRTTACAGIVPVMAGAAVLLITQCAIVLWLAPFIALLGMALTVGAGLMLAMNMRRAWQLSHDSARAKSGITDTAAQLLGGFKLAVAQGLQTAFTARMEAEGRSLLEARVSLLCRHSRGRVIGTTAAGLCAVAAILIGVSAGMRFENLIVGLTILMRMTGPALLLQQQAAYLVEDLPGWVSQRKLTAELSRSSREHQGEADPASTDAVLAFRNLTYRYPGGDTVILDGIDLAIGPGEFVGLVGPSGTGKTTILDLAAGLFHPTAGQVIGAGRGSAGAQASAWRQTISYASQDPFLFNGTVRDNLTFGVPNIGQDAIDEALGLVGASPILDGLPDGLETFVGERGSRLSGGQRQRIVLARALLRRPCLLLLDEATNALDLASEDEVLARLRSLPSRPAALIVSHRPEALRKCDRIYRLEPGGKIRIIAAGA